MSTLIPTALVTRCARAGHEVETRAHPSGQPVAWGDLTWWRRWLDRWTR